MRVYKGSAFSLLIAFSGASQAVEQQPVISAPDSSCCFTSPFFSQSSMTLLFKNYWKYLKEENANPKRVHNAWGQGVALDYQSGYLADIIGVDADYYGVAKLGASDYFNSRGVLYSHGAANQKSSAHGYTKFGQRNIKLKLHPADATVNARWGWQKIKKTGVITSSTRLSPTTYLGWTGAMQYNAVTLRGAYVERSMARNSPDTMRFQTNAGNYINHIATGDVQWKNETLNILYGYGESYQYLRRQLVLAQLTPSERLSFGSQIYRTHALDAYSSMPASKRDFDNNAWHVAADATWKGERWSSKWGVAYTEARKKDEVGFFPRHMSKQSFGNFISMAYAGDDYMRDGELVLSNLSDYALTPDLSVGLTGNIAQFSYRKNHVRTGEISAFTRWMPVRDLTLWAIAGPGWSYKAQGKTPVLHNGRYDRTHTLSSEIIVEYKFKIF